FCQTFVKNSFFLLTRHWTLIFFVFVKLNRCAKITATITWRFILILPHYRHLRFLPFPNLAKLFHSKNCPQNIRAHRYKHTWCVQSRVLLLVYLYRYRHLAYIRHISPSQKQWKRTTTVSSCRPLRYEICAFAL